MSLLGPRSGLPSGPLARCGDLRPCPEDPSTREIGQRDGGCGATGLSLLRSQAEAAQSQSVAAEAALNASARPLVIDIPRHTMKTVQVQQRPGIKHPEEVDLS